MATNMREDFKNLMAGAARPNALEIWPKGVPMPDQFKIWHDQVKEAQLFELDASTVEVKGKEVSDKLPFIATHQEFNPLYDRMAVFINGDIKIPVHQGKGVYKECLIIGFSIRKWQAPAVAKMFQIMGAKVNYPAGDWYDCYIYTMGDIGDGRDGINTQDCMFIFEKTAKGSFIHLPEHLGMCASKDKCRVNVFGTDKGKGVFCKEIVARRLFTYVVLDVMDQLNEPREVIHKTSQTKPVQVESQTPQPEGLSKVFRKAVSYVRDIVIDRPRVVYDQVSGHRQGGKHKIRYDVRRHIRIHQGRIIWVSSYQRGQGEYVQRWHKKSRTVVVTRYQQIIERVSTHPAIEPWLVKVIQFIRGLR